jgi:hypothetical protein
LAQLLEVRAFEQNVKVEETFLPQEGTQQNLDSKFFVSKLKKVARL